MKKLFLSLVILALSFSQCFATTQWRNGTTESSVPGTVSPSDLDTEIYNHIVSPLDSLLSNYRHGCALSYSSASAITIGAGEIVCSNSAGTIRLFAKNTSSTSATFSDLDTGSEAASTTYYVYAIMSAVSDTTFTVKISASATAPSTGTYFRRLGSFYNDASSNIRLINNDDDDKEYGDWASKTTDVVYQATTDGNIHAVVNAGAGYTAQIRGYTDGSNPPTTERMSNHCYDPSAGSTAGIEVDVKKGDYWKVTGGTTVYWLPKN